MAFVNSTNLNGSLLDPFMHLISRFLQDWNKKLLLPKKAPIYIKNDITSVVFRLSCFLNEQCKKKTIMPPGAVFWRNGVAPKSIAIEDNLISQNFRKRFTFWRQNYTFGKSLTAPSLV